MKTIEDMPEAAEDHAGFILTDRTVAALSQLDPVERDQVGLTPYRPSRAMGCTKNSVSPWSV